MSTREGVNGVWKWIAGSIIVVAIAFMTPSVGWFIDSRDQVKQEDFSLVRERQQVVLQRLAVLETQMAATQSLLASIQTELRNHELNDQSRSDGGAR